MFLLPSNPKGSKKGFGSYVPGKRSNRIRLRNTPNTGVLSVVGVIF